MSIAQAAARHRAPVTPGFTSSQRVPFGIELDRALASSAARRDQGRVRPPRWFGSQPPSQALLLYNMGDNELTAGELKSRGYYLGSNVSYNLKKLVDMGYVDYERSETDRRSVRVSLSAKGRQAAKVVGELYQRQLARWKRSRRFPATIFQGLNKALQRLERFWTDQIRYQL